MYILVNTLNNEIIDWRSKESEPFVVGENQLQVCDNFNFVPNVFDAVWRYLGDHKFEYRYMKDGSDLPDNYLFYDIFMVVLINKDLVYNLQYKTTSDGYLLQFYDGHIPFYCKLNSIDHSTEIADFETNYKDNANKPLEKRSIDGATIIAPTLDDVQGLYPKKKMYKHQASAESIGIFDTVVDVEKRICGGEYWIYDEDVDFIGENDYVEFSIVDKNDILGVFQYYGLSIENGDVLELTKFVINDYIRKGNKLDGWHSVLYEGIKGTNILYPGLFMRVSINNEGINNFRFLWRCYYYE